MNGGWWGLLILILTLPTMGAGVVIAYLGIADLRKKDHFGWVVLLIGWMIFWLSLLYTVGFIYDNLTP